MSNTKEILGRLRALRKAKELRQGFIAERLGIDRTTYARKERGLIPITTDEWIRLAEVMDEDISYFFTSRANPTRVEGGAAGEGEAMLLKLFRSMSSEEKKSLLAIVLLVIRMSKNKKAGQVLKEMEDARAF